MMPARAENIDQDPENGTQSMLHSNLYAQPWWRGARNSTSVGNGDGSYGREDTHAKNILTSITPSTGDHLAVTSSRELFGHSIVLTSSLCSDPRYGGPVTNYGPQAMVPHFYGIHHGRMPLPLEMAEEPVYVNAKQYHGILRRRRVRAKAELEKKVMKGRKPYLHESRHRHAMRRPRGSGGRFLNTKKLESKVSNLSLGKASNACVELSTQSANSITSQSSPSSIARADSTGHMLKFRTSSNGNDSVYGFSSVHDLDAVECKDISYLGVPKETLQLYEAPNGAYNK